MQTQQEQKGDYSQGKCLLKKDDRDEVCEFMWVFNQNNLTARVLSKNVVSLFILFSVSDLILKPLRKMSFTKLLLK